MKTWLIIGALFLIAFGTLSIAWEQAKANSLVTTALQSPPGPAMF